MKVLLTVLLLLFTASLNAQKQKPGVMYDVQVVRVIDGDTVVIAAPWLLAPLKPELAVRVFGVDTPEKGSKAKCPQEDQLGRMATSFTKSVVGSGNRVQMYLIDWDKYGGRVLGDIVVNGNSLRMLLIQKGYAREYYGTAKTSWC